MTAPKSRVLILTETFPYPGGDDFLLDELPSWLSVFDSVTLLPAHAGATPFDVPVDATVDTALCRRDSPATRVGWLLRVLLTSPRRVLREVLPLLARGHLVAAVTTAKAYARWARAVEGIRGSLANERYDLIYGYWMNAEVFAAAHLRRSGRAPLLISRVHGIDLHEDRWPASHMPLRARMIDGIDRILPISVAGREHLSTLFPELTDRLEVHRLGVASTRAKTAPTAADEFHVVTVASCVPVKRLERVPPALALLRERIPGVQITWTHIGDGPGRDELSRITSETIRDSMPVRFLGRLPPATVLQQLEMQRIDVVLNVSDSEGVPVALMEGMARGIPAVGPEVGGIPELISHGTNGWLLPAKPTPDQIAGALADVWHLAKHPEVRQAAAVTVDNDYSSDRNYQHLAGCADLWLRPDDTSFNWPPKR